MAGNTILGGNEMGVGMSHCRHTIMTGYTIIADTLMVEAASNESSCRVTEVTIQRCWNMSSVFARCGLTIVTGRTVIHYTGMVEHRTDKCRCIMTYATILVG